MTNVKSAAAARGARGAAAMAAVLLATACAPSLAVRRAQTMKPGELEVLVSPQVTTTTASVPGLPGEAKLLGAFGASTIEASFRTGLDDATDLQVRVDPTVLPEVTIGRELLDGGDEEMTVAVTAGAKPSLAAGLFGGTTARVATPVQLLVDRPLTPRLVWVSGARLVPVASLPLADDGALAAELTAGVVSALHMKLGGGLALQPELGVSTTVPLVGAPTFAGAAGAVPITLSAGLTFGGSFDFRSPLPAPSQCGDECAPAVAPASAHARAAERDRGSDPMHVAGGWR